MSMITIYKEDSIKKSWKCILNDFGLPDDTDEICIKHISHVTKSQRKMQYNTCKTCGANNGRAGILLSGDGYPEECVNCNTTRLTGEVFIDTSLYRTEEELKKTIAILE